MKDNKSMKSSFIPQRDQSRPKDVATLMKMSLFSTATLELDTICSHRMQITVADTAVTQRETNVGLEPNSK